MDGWMAGSSNGQGSKVSEVSPGGNAIEVRDLRKAFGRQPVLRGVDLDCPTGLITTIVGPSGCGKTVLLKHLTLLLRPDSGKIAIDGENVDAAPGIGARRACASSSACSSRPVRCSIP